MIGSASSISRTHYTAVMAMSLFLFLLVGVLSVTMSPSATIPNFGVITYNGTPLYVLGIVLTIVIPLFVTVALGGSILSIFTAALLFGIVDAGLATASSNLSVFLIIALFVFIQVVFGGMIGIVVRTLFLHKRLLIV